MENIEKSGYWEQVLSQALEAVQQGRSVLLNYFGNLEHVEEKFQAGLVSEADKESERVISEFLKKKFPKIDFLGEETFAKEHGTGGFPVWPDAGPDGRWILDPLDGTTNYIHRFPIFCISLALEYQGEIQIAVIDVPMLNETYTAIKGQGAFLNGKKIRTTDYKGLKKSLLATGFVAEHEHIISEQLNVFSNLVRKCRGVRRPGAAAYDLALVAKGVFDGYWERNIQPWDGAAGLLLVQEAGGVVETYRGKKYTPFLNSVVAGNSQLVAEIQKEMGPLISEGTH